MEVSRIHEFKQGKLVQKSNYLKIAAKFRGSEGKIVDTQLWRQSRCVCRFSDNDIDFRCIFSISFLQELENLRIPFRESSWSIREVELHTDNFTAHCSYVCGLMFCCIYL